MSGRRPPDLLDSLLVAAALVVLAGLFAVADAALHRGLAGPGRRAGPRGRVAAPRALQAIAADRPRYINLLLLLRLLCELTATALVALVTVDAVGGDRGWLAVLVTAGSMTGGQLRGRRRRAAHPRPPARLHRRAGSPHRWCAGSGRALGPAGPAADPDRQRDHPGPGFREGPFASTVELRELVDLAEQRGVVEHGEREMIQSVFALGDTIVREVMVPRTEMVWIEAHKTLRQALMLVAAQRLLPHPGDRRERRRRARRRLPQGPGPAHRERRSGRRRGAGRRA